jgi:serine/threonine protein kinase
MDQRIAKILRCLADGLEHYRFLLPQNHNPLAFEDEDGNPVNIFLCTTGAFGGVYCAEDALTLDVVCAIKIVRHGGEIERIPVEIEIGMAVGDHPGICGVRAHHIGARHYLVAMDHADGGDLLFASEDYAHYRWPESRARAIASQLIAALAHMHERNHVHIDLKPENVLLRSADADDVMICDFGLSRRFYRHDDRRATCGGTLPYTAPELCMRERGAIRPAADAWSLGCLVLWMISGDIPREHTALVEWRRHAPMPDGVSEAAANFVDALIVADPARRMTVADAAAHPWIGDGGGAASLS